MKLQVIYLINYLFFSKTFNNLFVCIERFFISVEEYLKNDTIVNIHEICAIVIIVMAVITVILCLEPNKELVCFAKCSILRNFDDECILIFKDINRPERTFRCALGEGIVIGRKPERCMIVLDRDIFVAERHCRIYRENNNLMIENLCKYKKLTVSSYGRADIKLNQKCVCELSDGDIIVLGLTALKIKIS